MRAIRTVRTSVAKLVLWVAKWTILRRQHHERNLSKNLGAGSSSIISRGIIGGASKNRTYDLVIISDAL